MGARGSAPVPQEAHPAAWQDPPGAGSPALAGVRVLELATVVAAPSATRVMAELGAEVIKVEDPRGDSWRYMMRQYEKGRERGHGSLFEAANLGKSSVVLNLKDPHGAARLRDLIAGADVFVTNLRMPCLQRLGLSYEQLRPDYPGLVYAHLTAWGRSGPDVGMPGYDLGAFWAVTGMAAAITSPGQYSWYPTGFGDTTTGMTLVGGVAAALAARTVTGRGMLVDACLLRTGAYCMQAQAADAAGSYTGGPPDYASCAPDPHPACASYRCMDSGCIAVLGHAGQASQLAAAVGAKEPRAELLQTAFAELQVGDAVRALAGAGVPHLELPVQGWPKCVEENTRIRDSGGLLLGEPMGVSDMRFIVAAPFSLGCSPAHGDLTRGAPALGAHTEAVLRGGWAKRPAALPATAAGGAAGEGPPLCFVDVLELGDDACAASCAAMLSEYGARVTSIDHTGRPDAVPATLRTQLQRWHCADCGHYSAARAKCVKCGRSRAVLPIGDAPARLRSLAAAAARSGRVVVLCTNWPLGELRSAGLHPEQVRREHPGVVVAAVSPLGIAAGDAERGDQGWWLRSAGLQAILKDAALPTQLGALVASMQLFAGVCCAVFHARRTGAGQIVELSYARSGAYAVHQSIALLTKDPAKRLLMDRDKRDARRLYPIPTCLCHVTQDGYWVQLLGVDMPRHLGKVLKALGVYGTAGASVCTVGCCCCCGCNCHKPNMLDRVGFAFDILNAAVGGAIGRRTRAELARLFAEHDVWYCDVCVPGQVARSPQLLETDALLPGDGDGPLAVRAPMRLTQ
eukprot:TRINITY_DN37343_c0_g1_i1.p1 TRINITY_DN37343_c0_g1~~TRINITY_DN37343_c0_g1_i1.p1  ORF type:complete len:861 (+),score=186.66 TRINITY_DN37343_c0_g1_i1:190-2583(+)